MKKRLYCDKRNAKIKREKERGERGGEKEGKRVHEGGMSRALVRLKYGWRERGKREEGGMRGKERERGVKRWREGRQGRDDTRNTKSQVKSKNIVRQREREGKRKTKEKWKKEVGERERGDERG